MLHQRCLHDPPLVISQNYDHFGCLLHLELLDTLSDIETTPNFAVNVRGGVILSNQLSTRAWELGCCFSKRTTTDLENTQGKAGPGATSESLHILKRLAWPVELHGVSRPQFPLWLAGLLRKRINTRSSGSNVHQHPVHSQVLLTMTPFIPNGTYKVRNGLYTNLVADLVDPTPGGAIAALTDSSFNVGDKVRAVLCRGLYSPI